MSLGLAVGILRWEGSGPVTVQATTVSEIQSEIDRIQQELEQEYGKISDLEAEQDLILEKMEDTNAELINTMASIKLKEEEIAAKEGEISTKEGEIAEKQDQIAQTSAEYEEAKSREEQQKLDMAARTKMLYEQGNESYLDILLAGRGLSDLLNRLDYIEKIYKYSRMQLDSYIETGEQLQDLWDLLEQEKADLEQEMERLKADKSDLKSQEAELDGQKNSLNSLLADMKRQSAQNAANGNYSSNYASIINNASGSELGKKIANFACQYIGGPYKAGGISLTNGADCSGFTYSVYSNFGYSIPRTSYAQRSAGTGVSYENAQPGDLICYDGHVAMYIGGGLVVHASNSNPYPRGGIKVSNAQYRTILAVRRII